MKYGCMSTGQLDKCMLLQWATIAVKQQFSILQAIMK